MTLKTIYVYGNSFEKIPGYNLKIIKNWDTELSDKIKVIIICDKNEKIFEISKNKKIIVFTNILEYQYISNYIYYKNPIEIKKNLDIINLKKTFTILIPIYNSYKYLDRCIDSVIIKHIMNIQFFYVMMVLILMNIIKI